MKKVIWAMGILLMLFCLRSSSYAQYRRPCTLVTRVEVRYTRPGSAIRRTYTQPDKMASVLNYLRILPYAGKPQTDPWRCPDGYDITLYYSDGGRRVFYQRGDKYLYKGANCWELVDPVRARLLYPLLLLLPGDV